MTSKVARRSSACFLTMSDSTLRISNLQKTYPGGITALNGISLEIPAGMFGVLGPNGAGKTTLMKILATLLEADAGTAEMNGVNLLQNARATRQMLGYLPQDFGLYPSFTAEQMLDYLAQLKGIHNRSERHAQLDALFERVNLSNERTRKLGTFSGGMRQRFGIAQALLGRPCLLIVDEPTAGLDPEERNRFHNLLAEIASDVVVLLSTHIVSDVANLCSRLAIIRRGEILATCAPSEALRQIAGRVWETSVSREVMLEMKARFNVISSNIIAGQHRLRVMAATAPSDDFTPATPTLEDYYFSLVNQHATPIT
jgi:ABC-2 type transport system ATP-binding protein